MAIQVSSTTVIDNSRNLNNIAGADATTVSSLESAGLGGASTGFGDVGTYGYGRPSNNTSYTAGDTNAGIIIRSFQRSWSNYSVYYDGSALVGLGTTHTMSGTWRAMTNVQFSTFALPGLWVRIS